MFSCSELVTGYDDYGRIIFLQSQCRRMCTKHDQPKADLCSGCYHRLARFVPTSAREESADDAASGSISQLVHALFDRPIEEAERARSR